MTDKPTNSQTGLEAKVVIPENLEEMLKKLSTQELVLELAKVRKLNDDYTYEVRNLLLNMARGFEYKEIKNPERAEAFKNTCGGYLYSPNSRQLEKDERLLFETAKCIGTYHRHVVDELATRLGVDKIKLRDAWHSVDIGINTNLEGK